jgi:hypothetical protein
MKKKKRRKKRVKLAFKRLNPFQVFALKWYLRVCTCVNGMTNINGMTNFTSGNSRSVQVIVVAIILSKPQSL